ncbi:hypothetical protein ACIGFK_28075 [Streptomyces sp. NPDC085524]|uniref:hypothetical protein n=1 Tax=unclassified Streptomyces TaxID=2593676 RepID=UPI0035DB1447
MDTQRGRTNRRRFLLIAGLPLLAVGGGMTYLLWPEPYRNPVRTDLEPLNERFGPDLGALSEAHWLGYDIDEAGHDSRTIPGPDSRIRLVGIAHLPPGGAAAVVRAPGRTFAPAEPSALPERLKTYVPAAAAWQHSPEFDAHLNGRSSDATSTSGEYHFDVERDLVRFDVLYLFS